MQTDKDLILDQCKRLVRLIGVEYTDIARSFFFREKLFWFFLEALRGHTGHQPASPARTHWSQSGSAVNLLTRIFCAAGRRVGIQ